MSQQRSNSENFEPHHVKIASMDICLILHFGISHIDHMHDIVFGGNQRSSGVTRSIVVALSQDKEVGYSLYVTSFSTYTSPVI